MNEQQIKDQTAYLVVINLARKYFERGIISEEQFCQFDTEMREKYKPFFGDLFPRNTLT